MEKREEPEKKKGDNGRTPQELMQVMWSVCWLGFCQFDRR